MNLLEEANGNPYGINSYIFNVKVYYPDDVELLIIYLMEKKEL